MSSRRSDRDPNRGNRRIPLSWYSAADQLGLNDDHNHVTRDIKPVGECPACDEYWGTNWGYPTASEADR